MSLVANERAVSRPEMIVNTAPVYLTHSAGLPVLRPRPEPQDAPARPIVRVRRPCVDDGHEDLGELRLGNDERQLHAKVAGDFAAGPPQIAAEAANACPVGGLTGDPLEVDDASGPRRRLGELDRPGRRLSLS
jgi:hypothetical protein